MDRRALLTLFKCEQRLASLERDMSVELALMDLGLVYHGALARLACSPAG